MLHMLQGTKPYYTPLPFPLSLPTLMLPVANGNPPHLHCIHPGHPSNIISQTVHQAITIQFYNCAYLPSLRSTSPSICTSLFLRCSIPGAEGYVPYCTVS